MKGMAGVWTKGATGWNGGWGKMGFSVTGNI